MKGFSVKSLLSNTGVYFSVMIVLLCLTQLLFGQGVGAVGQVNLSAGRVLWLLPFALTLALLHALRLSAILSGGLTFIVHMAGTLLGFFLFAYLPAWGGSKQNPVVIFAAVLAVYLLSALIWYLFNRRYRDQKERETTYAPRYQKPNS